MDLGKHFPTSLGDFLGVGRRKQRVEGGAFWWVRSREIAVRHGSGERGRRCSIDEVHGR